jgi:hypothetical protein
MTNNGHGKNPARTTYCMHYGDVDDSPSFNAMRPNARLLVMRAKRFYNRTTQEPIFMSVRMAAKLVRISKLATASSLINEVVHHGFWRMVSPGYLGNTGEGVGATFCLTDERFRGRAATCDFKKWDGVPFWTGKSRKKTKTRVPGVHTPVSPEYTSRVPGVHRPNGNCQGMGPSEISDPVYPGDTHLDVLAICVPGEEGGRGGNGPEASPLFGLGHNEGPPLNDWGDLRGMPRDLTPLPWPIEELPEAAE